MLYLASQSPRRQQLIKKVTLNFKAVSVDAAEITTGDKHDELALANATIKALAAYKIFGETVLGSDTVVSSCGRLYLKPKDSAEAYEMLKSLSGKTHKVYTGICVISSSGEFKSVKKSYVTFNELSEELIRSYLDSNLWQGKAGSYGVQDNFGIVKSFRGGLDNIMGLSVKLSKELLIKSGFVL